jgi:hypothetical protein
MFDNGDQNVSASTGQRRNRVYVNIPNEGGQARCIATLPSRQHRLLRGRVRMLVESITGH